MNDSKPISEPDADRASASYDHLIEPALDASPDCIKIIGPDGRLRHMNRAGCLALGVDPQKVAGIDWVGLLPPSIHEAGRKALAEAARGETVRFYGLSDGGEAGLRRWDNMLTPLRNAAGAVENILCISRDVTDGRTPNPLPPDAPSTAGAFEPLSLRERECLLWAHLGKTAWETSVILGRSRRTVEFHLANAVKKLGAANKYQAATIALQKGLL